MGWDVCCCRYLVGLVTDSPGMDLVRNISFDLTAASVQASCVSGRRGGEGRGGEGRRGEGWGGEKGRGMAVGSK